MGTPESSPPPKRRKVAVLRKRRRRKATGAYAFQLRASNIFRAVCTGSVNGIEDPVEKEFYMHYLASGNTGTSIVHRIPAIAEPSLILPGEIYLSGTDYMEWLNLHPGIRTIVSLVKNNDDRMTNPEEHLPSFIEEVKQFKFLDETTEDMLSRAMEIVEFHRQAPKPVLYHCHSGISRSATAVMLILAAKAEFAGDYEAVVRHVFNQRRCVRPNPGFLGQVLQFSEMQKRERC